MDSRNGFREEDIDEDLARAQEESLRLYEEVELPRLNGVRSTASSNDGAVPSTSKQTDRDQFNNSSILCSQVGGKAGTFLYEGDEAKGFHIVSGKTYIYPTNYPVRAYQANMVRTALFANTLISLPTGLGKTFIAAVVMYNFYRWYPFGKIVFMAPTRPLVAQQIKACYDVMGIPMDDTTEMTGNQNVESRKALWKEKRVFFLTPQVMANDVLSKICPSDLVKCVVVDEAHKAVKEFAYCQVIKQLLEVNPNFRILALSATPGKDINTVQQVIRNLNISRLEIRGEDSIDVQQYTFYKLIESVVLEPSKEMLLVKNDFLEVYDKYAKRLKELKALPNNISFLSKFQVLKAMEKFRAHPPSGLPPTVIGSLISDFTVCMTMAHSLDLLQLYGLRAVYNYFTDEGADRSKAAGSRLKNDQNLKTVLGNLYNALNPSPELNLPYVWGHPKLKKLVALLDQHFSSGEPTKAIVFCQYRVVVMEIVKLLSGGERRYKVAEFIGQSGGREKGMPQSKQIQIMQEFREGKIQVLVATCVAEEGLDIGEVDLIVLMETQSSPVRFVQRLGRTGRKRKGKCVVLLSKGREEEKFREAMASIKTYVARITNSNAVKTALNPCTPSMFPPGVKPEKECMHIKVDHAVPEKTVKPVKKQMDVREFLAAVESPYLSTEELQKVTSELGKNRLEFNEVPKGTELWARCFGKKMSIDELLNKDISRLSHWNDWFAEEQKTFKISHTSLSSNLRDLLNFKPQLVNSPARMKLLSDTTAQSPLKEDTAKWRLTTSPVKLPVDTAKKRPTTSPVKLPVDNASKKVKKKKEPIKNPGMDIRECLAKAVARDKWASQKTNYVEDEVIFIDDDVGLPIRFPQVANIFNLKPDDFEILLKNEYESVFDGENEFCTRLEKYSLKGKKVEWTPLKPVNFDVDWASVQIEQVISHVPDKNPVISPPKCIPPENGDKFDFASFDDLFDDDFELPSNLCEIEGNDKNLTAAKEPVSRHDCTPPQDVKKLMHKENESMRFMNHSSPSLSTVIHRSSVLVDIQPNKNKFVDISPIASTKTRETKNSSEKILFNTAVASTPIVPSKKKDESEEDAWNLDDLFEDEGLEDLSKVDDANKSNISSQMGVTQMFKEIEQNKNGFQKDDTVSTATCSSIKKITQKSSNFKAFKPKQRTYSQADSTIVEKPIQEKPVKLTSVSKRKLSFDAHSNTSTPISNKRKSSLLDDSDEDDDMILMKPIRKKPPSPSRAGQSSAMPKPTWLPPPRVSKITKIKSRVKKNDDFIEKEADVSGALSEDDSDNSSLDEMDESFINDESVPNASVGNYLQSVRSPLNGIFKINPRNKVNNCVYSQRVDDNYLGEYENDSFCVESEGESLATSPSFLDEVEKALKRRKRSRTPLSSTTSTNHSTTPEDVVVKNNRKRRRIITSDSDDTDSPNRSAPTAQKEDVITVSSSDGSGDDGKGEMTDSERQFQSDLQKALYLSQVEVQKPSFSKLPIPNNAKKGEPCMSKLEQLKKLNSKHKQILGSISRTDHNR